MDNSDNDGENAGLDGTSFQIYDTDSTVGYTGSWVLNTFTIPDLSDPQTSHSTAEPNAGIFIPFNVPSNGFVLYILGVIPPGSGEITANYTFDNGQPNTRTVPIITQDTPEFYQRFYASPLLEEGPHNLSIRVLETGKGRNYTFHFANVSLEDSSGVGESNQPQSGNDQGGTRSTAIVGGVLGAVIVLLLGLFIVYHLRVRRRIHPKGSGNAMEQQSNAPDAQRTVPASFLAERSVSAIDPYILPVPEPRRASTVTSGSRAISVGTALTNPPAYATIDAGYGSSIQSQAEFFATGASYVSSGNEPLVRSETDDPSEDGSRSRILPITKSSS